MAPGSWANPALPNHHKCPPPPPPPQELYPLLRKLGGLGEGEAVEAYEEVKFEPAVMVDKLTPTKTLAMLQLEDGDILVFQRTLPQVGGTPAPAPRPALLRPWREWGARFAPQEGRARPG